MNTKRGGLILTTLLVILVLLCMISNAIGANYATVTVDTNGTIKWPTNLISRNVPLASITNAQFVNPTVSGGAYSNPTNSGFVRVSGAGYAGNQFPDSGSTNAAIFLEDTTGSTGSGGLLLFGGYPGKWSWGLKTFLHDTNHGVSYLVFANRTNDSATSLTEQWAFTPEGTLQAKGSKTISSDGGDLTLSTPSGSLVVTNPTKGIARTLDTVTSLAAYPITTIGTEAVVTDADRGGRFVLMNYYGTNIFVDDGTVFQSTYNTNYAWQRIYDGAVNVRWFGAISKGSDATDEEITTNTEAFRRAMNSYGLDTENSLYEPPTGRIIYVPSGVYRINSTLYLRKGDVLRGDGWTSTEIYSTVPDTNTTISCLVMVGGYTNTVTEAYVSDDGGIPCIVEGIFFTGTGQFPAIWGQCPEYLISKCWFSFSEGIRMDSSGGLVRDCVFDICQTGIRAVGNDTGDDYTDGKLHFISDSDFFKCFHAAIVLRGVNHINIDNCDIVYNKYGIYTESYPGATWNHRVKIHGCQFVGSPTPGYQTDIFIYAPTPLNRSEISDCTFAYAKDYAIVFEDTQNAGIVIQNNQFWDSQNTTIRIFPGPTSSDAYIIRDNRFQGSLGPAIFTQAATTILDNNFMNYNTGFSWSYPTNAPILVLTNNARVERNTSRVSGTPVVWFKDNTSGHYSRDNIANHTIDSYSAGTNTIYMIGERGTQPSNNEASVIVNTFYSGSVYSTNHIYNYPFIRVSTDGTVPVNNTYGEIQLFGQNGSGPFASLTSYQLASGDYYPARVRFEATTPGIGSASAAINFDVSGYPGSYVETNIANLDINGLRLRYLSTNNGPLEIANYGYVTNRYWTNLPNSAIAPNGWTPANDAGQATFDVLGSDDSIGGARIRLGQHWNTTNYFAGITSWLFNGAASSGFTFSVQDIFGSTNIVQIGRSGLRLNNVNTNQILCADANGYITTKSWTNLPNSSIAPGGWSVGNNSGQSYLHVIGSDDSNGGAAINLMHTWNGVLYNAMIRALPYDGSASAGVDIWASDSIGLTEVAHFTRDGILYKTAGTNQILTTDGEKLISGTDIEANSYLTFNGSKSPTFQPLGISTNMTIITAGPGGEGIITNTISITNGLICDWTQFGP